MTTSSSMVERAAIPALIERLEKAEGPDREIDVLLWREFGWSEIRDPERNSVTDILGPDVRVNTRTISEAIDLFLHTDANGIARAWNVPRLTASLDAALALVERVLPERGWFVGSRDDGSDLYCAGVDGELQHTGSTPWGPSESYREPIQAESRTPPIALLIAALKAIAQTDGMQG
jgi:hypothetical protein